MRAEKFNCPAASHHLEFLLGLLCSAASSAACTSVTPFPQCKQDASCVLAKVLFLPNPTEGCPLPALLPAPLPLPAFMGMYKGYCKRVSGAQRTREDLNPHSGTLKNSPNLSLSL